MAKATFHRNQRVWVDTVGTWAVIERVTPIWASGFEEPVRITYEVGLGRPFLAHELAPEEPQETLAPGGEGEWRLMRAKNKWQSSEDCEHHPYPGTFPVVVTDANDWGGWRVPGAEYDRDPHRVERQARIVCGAPRMMHMLAEFVAAVAEAPDAVGPDMLRLAQRADRLLKHVEDKPKPTPVGVPTQTPDRRAA